MSEVIIVMPTYNEAENIRKLVPSILQVLAENRIDGYILVVDDSSPDGTADVAEQMGRETGKVRVLKRPGKLGLGSAYVDGFKYVFDNMVTAKYVCEMDADGSHPPEILPQMVSLAEKGGYDVIIASRYIHGGRWGERSLTRSMISRGANILARASTGINVKDLTSGYRIIRLDILKRVVDKLSKLHSGYVFQVELLYFLHKAGAKISEYPFIFKPRMHGRSKLGRGEIISFALWCLRSMLTRLIHQ
ncbi:MAG: polyprenol monophosphomannose synthase [Nitrososphaerota archaeon]